MFFHAQIVPLDITFCGLSRTYNSFALFIAPIVYFVQISRGYSETVTIFYAHIIADAISKSDAEEQTFEEFIAKNKYIEAKDLLFKYYSLETIQSKESAVRFVFVIINGSRSVVDPAPPLKLVTSQQESRRAYGTAVSRVDIQLN